MKFIVVISTCLLIVPALLAESAPSSGLFTAPWRLVPNVTISSRECMMCKFSVSLVNYALMTQRGAERVSRFANSFCTIAHIESPLVCSNITKLFNHEVIKVLTNAILTPDQVCGYMSNNTCGHYHDPMSDWEVNLNASTSLNQEELEQLRLVHQRNLIHENKLAGKEQKPFRVIHLSDTHIDLQYKEGSNAICQEPLCCRPSSSSPSDNKTKPVEAGFWGSYGSCDVPLRTFEASLKAINSTIATYGDIEYIIWTGDIQPHDVWDQNKKSAFETYNAVFEMIFEYLPNVRIFPTFGNHEMVPVDSFSPSNLISIARDDSPEWLYRKLDSFWSKWLPESTVKTITKDGFYAATVKPGLKIISLNTNFCHNKNFWLYINATDPGDQLQWLIHELQISELEHEQVHIIGHIPPGADDCLKVWSKNFNRIVRRFANTITGQFYGHTHNNELEVFYDKEAPESQQDVFNKLDSETKPISVALIGPSITTFIDLNPSFRVYTIEPSLKFVPTNMESIYMNLTEANQNTQLQPKWQSKLFDQEFGTGIRPEAIHNLLLEMVDELNDDHNNQQQHHQQHDVSKSSNNFYIQSLTGRLNSLNQGAKKSSLDLMDSKFYKLYRMFHNYSDKYTKAEFDKWSLDEKKAFLCKFFSSQSHNTQFCKKFISDNVNFDYISVY